MDKEEHLITFPFLNDKYIILYDDPENKAPELHDKYKFLIIIFLTNKSLRQYDDSTKYPYILEIYIDDFSEELLIKYSYCIIYLNNNQLSDNLVKYVSCYTKLIINNIQSIDEYIQFMNNNPTNEDILKLIHSSIIHFNKNYPTITKDNNLTKNINMLNKKINYTDYNNSKINILMFYCKNELEIINVIQKKCINENIKNKYIEKIYVFGENLENEIIDRTDNLVLCETNKNVSFGFLNNYAKEFLNNKIVCILRGDIILLNNSELDNLDMLFDIEEVKQKIVYTISRSDRLLNGNIIKYHKLNRILFSTEQDAWIFKSPLCIDNNDIHELSPNDKYSELYFNNILKKNNYNLLNYNDKFRIIRILHENNLDSRPLLKNNIDKKLLIDTKNIINLVPDSSIHNVSIDSMLNMFNIDANELYLIKCELFNKYYKSNLLNEL